jgi:hypothetical protein
MIMGPGTRKAALLVHVMSSIGWFGAVAAFLALALIGLTSRDPLQVRSAYLATEVTTRFAIFPLAVVSFVSGIVSSVGTKWGLFRYYWVLMKLAITSGATLVLIAHLRTIESLQLAATQGTAFGPQLQSSQRLMVVASGAALVVLLVLTAISIYKPRGLTPYGQRRLDAQYAASDAADEVALS